MYNYLSTLVLSDVLRNTYGYNNEDRNEPAIFLYMFIYF